MPYLNSNTLSLDRLASAIAWDYIVSARHELIGSLNRYRFEVAQRDRPIEFLQLTGVPGYPATTEVLDTKLLRKLLEEGGMTMAVIDAIAYNGCYGFHHLRGTDSKTACGLAYHLPAVEPPRLHLVTPFRNLAEADQCPRCRNIVEPSYLPVWRFRKPVRPSDESHRRLKLPG